MEVNFSKLNDAATPTTEHLPVTTPAGDTIDCPVTHNAGLPAVRSNSLGLSDHVPGISEIILPRINLVQSVGGLKDSFPQGAIVHNQTTVLFTPPAINVKTSTIERAGTAALVITVLSFRKTQYVEKVAGGGRGLLCNSEAEVRAAGGTLDYKEWKLKEKDGIKRFEYLATALVAIERPEIAADDDTIFVYPVDDKKYALALWGMKGSAYTRAAKAVFFTARNLGCLRAGYPAHCFNFTTRQEPTPDKTSTYWVPVCLPNRKNSPDFLAWVCTVLEAPKVEVPEDDAF